MDEKKIEVKVNDDEIEVNVDKNLESPQSSDVSLEKKSVFKVIGNWMLIHILKPLWKYLKGIAFDFKRDISENPNIIFGICLMIPAILIGFMLSTHIKASFFLGKDYTSTGFQMFVLEMAGCLNVVFGFGIIKKRNLKSSIFATICTAILVTCGVLWCKAFISSKLPEPNNSEVIISALNADSDCMISFISVIISCLLAVAGTIGSFFFINKNYKKETL